MKEVWVERWELWMRSVKVNHLAEGRSRNTFGEVQLWALRCELGVVRCDVGSCELLNRRSEVQRRKCEVWCLGVRSELWSDGCKCKSSKQWDLRWMECNVIRAVRGVVIGKTKNRVCSAGRHEKTTQLHIMLSLPVKMTHNSKFTGVYS